MNREKVIRVFENMEHHLRQLFPAYRARMPGDLQEDITKVFETTIQLDRLCLVWALNEPEDAAGEGVGR